MNVTFCMDKDSSFLMERSDRYSMLATPSLALALAFGRGPFAPGASGESRADGSLCFSRSVSLLVSV